MKTTKKVQLDTKYCCMFVGKDNLHVQSIRQFLYAYLDKKIEGYEREINSSTSPARREFAEKAIKFLGAIRKPKFAVEVHKHSKNSPGVIASALSLTAEEGNLKMFMITDSSVEFNYGVPVINVDMLRDEHNNLIVDYKAVDKVLETMFDEFEKAA